MLGHYLQTQILQIDKRCSTLEISCSTSHENTINREANPYWWTTSPGHSKPGLVVNNLSMQIWRDSFCKHSSLCSSLPATQQHVLFGHISVPSHLLQMMAFLETTVCLQQNVNRVLQTHSFLDILDQTKQKRWHCSKAFASLNIRVKQPSALSVSGKNSAESLERISTTRRSKLFASFCSYANLQIHICWSIIFQLLARAAWMGRTQIPFQHRLSRDTFNFPVPCGLLSLQQQWKCIWVCVS